MSPETYVVRIFRSGCSRAPPVLRRTMRRGDGTVRVDRHAR